MESRITIDIRPTGEPFLYIDFRKSEDLRDKVLGRFLCESGGVGLNGDGSEKNPTTLHLHVLSYDQQTGQVQAMIEHPSCDIAHDVWEAFQKANAEYYSADRQISANALLEKNHYVVQRASAEWGAKWMHTAMLEKAAK